MMSAVTTAIDPARLIDRDEASRILGVSPRTVARRAENGTLPVLARLTDQRVLVFDRDAIEALAGSS